MWRIQQVQLSIFMTTSKDVPQNQVLKIQLVGEKVIERFSDLVKLLKDNRLTDISHAKQHKKKTVEAAGIKPFPLTGRQDLSAILPNLLDLGLKYEERSVSCQSCSIAPSQLPQVMMQKIYWLMRTLLNQVKLDRR